MWAAVPKNPEKANLFRLVLSLSSQEQATPPPLVEYFDTILRQAKKLTTHPESLSGEILPEAIEIAFEIKSNNFFSKEIMRVSDYKTLTPKKASSLLKNLEESPVY